MRGVVLLTLLCVAAIIALGLNSARLSVLVRETPATTTTTTMTMKMRPATAAAETTGSTRAVPTAIRNHTQVARQRSDDDCFTDKHHVEARFAARRADGGCLRMSRVRRRVVDLVHKLGAALDSAGIDYWLDGGTLLGTIRNKSMIPVA